MAEKAITIRIVGDASGASKGFKDAAQDIGTLEAKVTGLGGKFSSFGTVFSGVMASSAVSSFTSFLKDGAQGAADDAAAMGRLQQAVTNTGKSYDDYGSTIDDAIARGQKLAFSDGETADALATLTNMTGDTDEAMRRLTLAQDLARGGNISLDQAAKLLGKTSDENTTALRRLGIQLGDNATAQDVLNAVDSKFGGQAGAFAESDAGKFAIAQQNVGELSETLGSALVPAVSIVSVLLVKLLAILSPLLEKLLGSTPVLIGVGTAIMAALVPALVAKTAALWASVAAWLAANAAMLPIIAVALAIGAAVALLYVAWQSNFLGIQDIITGFVAWLTPFIQTALDTLLAVWTTVWSALQPILETAFALISGVVQFYVDAWSLIITTALSVIQTAWGLVWPVLQAVVETAFPIVAAVVGTYIGIAQAEIETALGIIQAVWNTVWPALSVVVETAMSGVSLAAGVITSVRDTISTTLGEIQAVWDPMWNGLKVVVDSVWNGVGGVMSLVSTGVGAVKGVIEGAKDGITGAWGAIWSTITGAVETAKGTIVGILNGIIGAANSVIGGINGFISTWNDLSVSIPEVKIAGQTVVPGYTLSTPNIDTLSTIPMLATGGLVMRPTLAMIGEKGPEAVIPLAQLPGMTANGQGFGSVTPQTPPPVTQPGSVTPQTPPPVTEPGSHIPGKPGFGGGAKPGVPTSPPGSHPDIDEPGSLDPHEQPPSKEDMSDAFFDALHKFYGPSHQRKPANTVRRQNGVNLQVRARTFATIASEELVRSVPLVARPTRG